MSTPIPVNETQRLAALRSYDILDSASEDEYDDLVALAAQICGTPIATITLVDETRQWFKARVGLTDQQTPRDVSFCAHAICSPGEELFVVPDAQQDPRFSNYANVVGDPHIRFYAGAPLVTQDGFALGTLCVIDRQPRELTPEQSRTLRALRRHVVNALELRRLGHAQRRYISELEETQRALTAARIRAEEATSAKSLFLATMTHEIRTPMNAVIGMTSILRETDLDATQHECVETIHSSGEVMLTLINDLLDLSKIEAGRLELLKTPFTAAEMVASSVRLVTGAAAAKGLRLTTKLSSGLPAQVLGDITRLRQILVNLLTNAVKFTAQGEVSVEVDCAPRPDGLLDLTVRVRDSGIGISAERLALLFQPYRQAETTTARDFGGTGLGLAICRRLAELHGGTISAGSVPGQGSVFTFTVTVERVTEAALPTQGNTDVFEVGFASRYPARILVADDNLINLKVASQLLQRLGYQPSQVENGQAVLDLLSRENFDLVLLDSAMPVMDGPTTARLIREKLPADRQPVIAALSAYTLTEIKRSWITDAYLEKPLRTDALKSLLTQLATLKAQPRK